MVTVRTTCLLHSEDCSCFFFLTGGHPQKGRRPGRGAVWDATQQPGERGGPRTRAGSRVRLRVSGSSAQRRSMKNRKAPRVSSELKSFRLVKLFSLLSSLLNFLLPFLRDRFPYEIFRGNALHHGGREFLVLCCIPLGFSNTLRRKREVYFLLVKSITRPEYNSLPVS